MPFPGCNNLTDVFIDRLLCVRAASNARIVDPLSTAQDPDHLYRRYQVNERAIASRWYCLPRINDLLTMECLICGFFFCCASISCFG